MDWDHSTAFACPVCHKTFNGNLRFGFSKFLERQERVESKLQQRVSFRVKKSNLGHYQNSSITAQRLHATDSRQTPAILHPDGEESWLNCTGNPFETVEPLLVPFPSDKMAAHVTTTQVNNSRYNEPDCGAPL